MTDRPEWLRREQPRLGKISTIYAGEQLLKTGQSPSEAQGSPTTPAGKVLDSPETQEALVNKRKNQPKNIRRQRLANELRELFLGPK